MHKEIILRRLTIIKQLFNHGVAQTRTSENLSSFSVLSFHDAVEMFLKLYAEYKNRTESYSFIKYWEKFPELPNKEEMNSLSLRRKNLKHKGMFPSKLDIEHSKFSTKDFLEKASKLIDNIDFTEISLTNLVSNLDVRDFLIQAEQAIDMNDHELVLEKTACAFHVLVSEYEKKAEGDFKSPFYFGESLNFFNSGTVGLQGFKRDSKDRKLGEFVDRVGKSIQEIQSAIKIISLGIDYRKYVKFKYLTPIVTPVSGGKLYCEIMGRYVKDSYPQDELQFLIDFVIESALKLQEFEVNYVALNFEKPYVTFKSKPKG